MSSAGSCYGVTINLEWGRHKGCVVLQGYSCEAVFRLAVKHCCFIITAKKWRRELPWRKYKIWIKTHT